MADFVAQFGSNGIMSSICDDSYAPALRSWATAIGRAFTSHCLDATVPDAIRCVPGIQASCDVVLRAPSKADQTMPACDAATPQGGPQPCWYLTASTALRLGRPVRREPHRRDGRRRDDLDPLRHLPLTGGSYGFTSTQST